ncbi:MAG: class I SAM-dependent methyltransferase [Ruminococcus bromii]|nr:class I SAM-dependent methyltransferase [Ruminococcus bromii]
MIDYEVRETNRQYWDGAADNWFGVTALPEYGVLCVTEDELHLFGDVTGKRMLEICCGSGHSLVYQAQHGAGELWGLDISESQLRNAKRHLAANGVTARLICAPMEDECGIPAGYFDLV